MRYKLLTLLLCLSVVACKKANDKNPALFGKWIGAEWLLNDRPSGIDAKKVRFEFMAEGTYAAVFGDQKQNGTWRTQEDKLYTTETGKQEIMVKLLQADGQHLDFEMNRGGQKEVLKLVKQD